MKAAICALVSPETEAAGAVAPPPLMATPMEWLCAWLYRRPCPASLAWNARTKSAGPDRATSVRSREMASRESMAVAVAAPLEAPTWVP